MQCSVKIGEEQKGGDIVGIVTHKLGGQIVRILQVALIVGNARVALQGCGVRGIFADEAVEPPQRRRLMPLEEIQVGKLQLTIVIAGVGGKERIQGLARLGVLVEMHLHAGQAHGVFGVRGIMRRQILEDGQGCRRVAGPRFDARDSLQGIGVAGTLPQEFQEPVQGGVILAAKGQRARQSNLGVVVTRSEFQYAIVGGNGLRVVSALNLQNGQPLKGFHILRVACGALPVELFQMRGLIRFPAIHCRRWGWALILRHWCGG